MWFAVAILLLFSAPRPVTEFELEFFSVEPKKAALAATVPQQDSNVDVSFKIHEELIGLSASGDHPYRLGEQSGRHTVNRGH